VALALLMPVLPVAAADQAKTQKISKKLIDRAEDMVKEIDKAKDQFNKTVKKYDSMFGKRSVKDRQKAFSELNKEIEKTEDRAKEVRKRSQDMQKESDKFFSEWSKGLDSIQDDDLRSLSHENMTENQDRYGEIIESGVEASDLYESFFTDMKSQISYLALDMSDSAMDKLKATQTGTKEKVKELTDSVDLLTKSTKDYIKSMK
jgi:hypothetical protein